MKTTTRPLALALLSVFALSAVACDEPAGENGFRLDAEEVAELMAEAGDEDGAAALLENADADSDEDADAAVQDLALELEFVDDEDAVASFPSRAECFATYCGQIDPWVTWSGQCVGGQQLLPDVCILLPEVDAMLPGCSFYAYEGEFCSVVG